MSGIFLCKSMLHLRCALSLATSSTHNVFSFHNIPPLLFSLKYISTNSKRSKQWFTVAYLINSCGLTPESALSASKHLNFKTPDKPDKVINFLKNQGFPESQIAKLISGCPTLLAYAHPEKTLLPKIKFFYSRGMSSDELWKLLSQTPKVLAQSLNEHIIPLFDYMKSLLGSDYNVIFAIKRYPRMLNHDYQSCVVPNVGILQDYGVPRSNIIHALFSQPGAFFLRPTRFKELVEEVRLLGFDPLRSGFVVAISVMSSTSKSNLESKHNALKHWGFSEKVITSTFIRFPKIMSYSKDKIMATMDFLVTEMGWESSHIIRYPELFGMSMEKRIVPRCSIIKVLLSKGLIKSISFSKVFYSTEKMFLQKFVICYEEEAPHLLKLYQDKLELSK